jgi:hypothetical protein
MLSYDLAVLWPRDFAAMSKRFFASGRIERDRLLGVGDGYRDVVGMALFLMVLAFRPDGFLARGRS